MAQLVDDQAPPCRRCQGTRVQYSYGHGQARRQCLGCKQSTYQDAAAECKQRLTAVALWREWWRVTYDEAPCQGPNPPSPPLTQLATLRAHMAAGRWPQAIKLAAGWPVLPAEHRAAILDGREALLRASFQRALGKDPVAQVAAAQVALQAAYGVARG